jgi:putative inorganic carbon (hco3(-)) transporter
VQTLERPTEPPPGRPPARSRTWLGLVALALAVPILVLMVVSRWGVALGLVLAAVLGVTLWVRQRGFLFIELVAFLIHYDGVGVGPIRTGRIVAAIAFLIIGYKLIAERWRPPAIPTRNWLPVLVMAIWATISGAWADVGGWLYAMGIITLAIAYFGVTGLLVDSHEKIMRFLRAYWWGGIVASSAGVIAMSVGARAVGFNSDPNYFGVLEASLIPLTVYYRRQETDRRRKFAYSLALIFVLTAAAGAGSRSGLIGGAIVIVATLVTRPGLNTGQRARVSVGAIVLGFLAFGIAFVANPWNSSRGFDDAGRLDFWNVTIELIKERPIVGQGFGTLKTAIVDHLATTPGVQRLTETREEVSSHNTWLDITGDMGVIGLLLWISIVVVAILGFLTPRWKQTREISTTLTVMMIPVLVSSMFLPLLNNKVLWSLVGLSAALQVPSWGTRWRGFAGTEQLGLPAGPRVEGDAPGVVPLRAGVAVAPPPGTRARNVAPAADDSMRRSWNSMQLARWDIKVSRRFRFSLVAGAVIGMVVAGSIAGALPTHYSASGGGMIVPQMSRTLGGRAIAFKTADTQHFVTLITSNAYAAELKRLAGLDLGVEEVRDRVTVERRGFSPLMDVKFTDTDEAVARQALPYVNTAIDRVIAQARASSQAETEDEIRPVLPGESRVNNRRYDIKVTDTTFLGSTPPPTLWTAFIGAIAGFLIAAGFMLFQQRKPRVNNDDDLPSAIGLWIWTHVGRAGRRYAATQDQYAQVVTSAEQLSPPDTVPRRIVIATPRPDRSARGLAMGVAGALAAQGRRAVLVDAQLDHRWLSLRLGGWFRQGLVQAADGQVPVDAVVRRINRWRLPSSVRRFVRGSTDQLRFIPAGRIKKGRVPEVRPEVLDRFGPDVTVVVLAPSLNSEVPTGALLNWGDAVVLALVEGRTVTFDAEDASAQVRTFAAAPAGVVLLDV